MYIDDVLIGKKEVEKKCEKSKMRGKSVRASWIFMAIVIES